MNDYWSSTVTSLDNDTQHLFLAKLDKSKASNQTLVKQTPHFLFNVSLIDKIINCGDPYMGLLLKLEHLGTEEQVVLNSDDIVSKLVTVSESDTTFISKRVERDFSSMDSLEMELQGFDKTKTCRFEELISFICEDRRLATFNFALFVDKVLYSVYGFNSNAERVLVIRNIIADELYHGVYLSYQPERFKDGQYGFYTESTDMNLQEAPIRFDGFCFMHENVLIDVSDGVQSYNFKMEPVKV